MSGMVHLGKAGPGLIAFVRKSPGFPVNDMVVSLFDPRDQVELSSPSMRLASVIVRSAMRRCGRCGKDLNQEILERIESRKFRRELARNPAQRKMIDQEPAIRSVCVPECEVHEMRWRECQACGSSFHMRDGGMRAGMRDDGVPMGFCGECLSQVGLDRTKEVPK